MERRERPCFSLPWGFLFSWSTCTLSQVPTWGSHPFKHFLFLWSVWCFQDHREVIFFGFLLLNCPHFGRRFDKGAELERGGGDHLEVLWRRCLVTGNGFLSGGGKLLAPFKCQDSILSYLFTETPDMARQCFRSSGVDHLFALKEPFIYPRSLLPALQRAGHIPRRCRACHQKGKQPA